MKKTIYRYFFNEFTRYFIVTLFALAAIVWTIQAVNFLDLVTDDGHAFKVYFLFSMLAFPKIITKLIPFSFLIASMLTILKMEKDNELIVLWTSGLNKIHLVNLVFRIAVLVMFLQFIMAIVLNPVTLNFSRSLLKNSQLQFIPSLLKERQFNDTIENLTIFVNKKNPDGTYENIFIRDDGKVITQVSQGSATIFAKFGYVSPDEKNLILLDGYIQKIEISSGAENADQKDKINIVKFEKTALNLSGLSTKTISDPKIQETSTLQILNCLQYQYVQVDMKKHNCNLNEKSLRDNKIEINRRFGMPFFIPLIGLIICFLLSSRRGKDSNFHKYFYFFICFLLLVFAEITVRYSGISFNHSVVYYLIPIGFLPLVYILLVRTFKYENLN